MLSLSHIASALGGKVNGRQVLCPGPGHSRADRSLSVRLSESNSDGFVVHSHAGDDWQACRDYVAAALGLAADRWRQEREVDPAAFARREAARRRAEEQEQAEAEWRQRRVAEMWHSARDPRGTLAARYYRSRGLDIPADIAGPALRFTPRCPWGKGETVPALIAAIRDMVTGEVRGLHRTALDVDGRKVGRRMFGVASGGAIMFDRADTGGGFLVVGEGCETVLTARQHMALKPAWALGSSSAISTLPVLDGIHTLIVLGENDTNGASARAIERVGARWHEAGRNVEIVWPPEGATDLNDTVREDIAACR